LTVSGPKKDLDDFKSFAKGTDPWSEDKEDILLSCAKFVEPPKEAIAEYSKFGYDWCKSHWGTNWGCYNITGCYSKRSLYYNFDSAWKPPLPVIKAMAKRYPTLRFHLFYREGGMCFQGHLICKGKKIIKQTESKYKGHCGG